MRTIVRVATLSALLSAGQVALAQLVGIATLDAEFTAGAERTQGVQVTLLVWFAAVAVVAAVTVAVRPIAQHSLAVQASAVPVAALAALAGAPVAARLSGPPIAADVWPAAISGVVLGALVAGITLVSGTAGRRPLSVDGGLAAVGFGVAAHAALLWLAALVSTLLPLDTVTYAGLVEPLGVEALRPLRSTIRSIPILGSYDYHLPWILPVAVAVVVLAIVLARRVTRRTGSRGAAVAAAVAGPLVAAASYRVRPAAVYLWNEVAADLAVLLAGCCVIAAAITVAATAPGRGSRSGFGSG